MTFCLHLAHLRPSVAPQAAFGESSPKIMKWECVYLWIHKADTDGIRDTVVDRTKPPSSAKFRVISPFYDPDLDQIHIYCFQFNYAQCLKMTKNVSFEFFNFIVFHEFFVQLKLTCLV